MMPAVLRSLLVATERHGLHAAVVSSRLLSRSATGAPSHLPAFGDIYRTTMTAACLRASCFAADAVQDSAQVSSSALSPLHHACRLLKDKEQAWLGAGGG